jgi:hypothetical protein
VRPRKHLCHQDLSTPSQLPALLVNPQSTPCTHLLPAFLLFPLGGAPPAEPRSSAASGGSGSHRSLQYRDSSWWMARAPSSTKAGAATSINLGGGSGGGRGWDSQEALSGLGMQQSCRGVTNGQWEVHPTLSGWCLLSSTALPAAQNTSLQGAEI